MTFEINPEALERLLNQPAVVERVTLSRGSREGAIDSGSLSYTGLGSRFFLSDETRQSIRLSLLSFEEDWNAPGMEAYDES
jgi:hypothetical protein